MWTPAGDIMSADKDTAVAVVDLVQAGHAFEQGAFACAVGPDKATQFSFTQIEIDVIDSQYATKTHRQIAGFDDHFTHDPLPVL
jgi:hypothetical protein